MSTMRETVSTSSAASGTSRFAGIVISVITASAVFVIGQAIVTRVQGSSNIVEANPPEPVRPAPALAVVPVEPAHAAAPPQAASPPPVAAALDTTTPPVAAAPALSTDTTAPHPSKPSAGGTTTAPAAPAPAGPAPSAPAAAAPAPTVPTTAAATAPAAPPKVPVPAPAAAAAPPALKPAPAATARAEAHAPATVAAAEAPPAAPAAKEGSPAAERQKPVPALAVALPQSQPQPQPQPLPLPLPLPDDRRSAAPASDKPSDKDLAREAWRRNLPDISAEDTHASVLIPIKGSIEGATYHVSTKPKSVIVNLPKADSLITMRFYKIKREGLGNLWIKQEEGEGTTVKLMLNEATAPQVEIHDEYIRINVRKPAELTE